MRESIDQRDGARRIRKDRVPFLRADTCSSDGDVAASRPRTWLIDRIDRAKWALWNGQLAKTLGHAGLRRTDLDDLTGMSSSFRQTCIHGSFRIGRYADRSELGGSMSGVRLSGGRSVRGMPSRT
jgi:hypothetical protein